MSNRKRESVCVCVRERKMEWKRNRERKTDRETDRQAVKDRETERLGYSTKE